jgi:hypothetical protein
MVATSCRSHHRRYGPPGHDLGVLHSSLLCACVSPSVRRAGSPPPVWRARGASSPPDAIFGPSVAADESAPVPTVRRADGSNFLSGTLYSQAASLLRHYQAL